MYRISVGLVVGLFAMLLGGPLVTPVLRNESRLWRLADWQNRAAAGDPAALDRILEMANRNQGLDPVAARVGVELLLERGMPAEALRLSRVLIEQSGPSALGIEQPLGQLHLRVLEANQRFAAALEWIQSRTDPRKTPSETDLNRLAYTRALANRELGLAREEIELAIFAVERQSLLGAPVRLELVALLSAAMLARAPEELAEFIAELDGEIAVREDEPPAAELGGASEPAASGPTSELSLLYTVRAKLWERIGKRDESFADRGRVAGLRGDADAILRAIPSNESLMMLAQYSAALLDTRGFVQARIDAAGGSTLVDNLADFIRFGVPGPGVRSLTDFDMAILAARAFYRHLEEYPTLTSAAFVDPETFPREQAQAREVLATLLYHRAEAKAAAGDEVGAANDRRQIGGLGLDPDRPYF